MAGNEDLINFDLIETHKENIQQLPGGRSAKSLAKTLSPMPFSGSSNEPTLDSTRTLNDAMRREYELEIQNIAESDDPLDIYHRYVKWTLDAYPSAQATPQSQLLPLLERATKAFLSSAHYKNDPRYLKLWLHYIRWFSDSPRETFAYLARHSIGEGLASFYEEFAAWLEGAGRWCQAEEVYKLGLEKNARPVERLTRKYGQFQQRCEGRTKEVDEPTSPALPTVRPALAAKTDPFASTPRSDQQQQSTQSQAAGTGASRAGKAKMAIFTDDANATPPALGASTAGWESIGSLQDRKKENTVAPKPWAGETLKAGSRVGKAEKMSVFKDKTMRMRENKKSAASEPVVNPKTGKAERVFVNLEAVYPNPSNPTEEMSFDELRARHRGWSDKVWQDESVKVLKAISGNAQKAQTEEAEVEELTKEFEQKVTVDEAELTQPSTQSQEQKASKQKKLRMREVKQETQTVKTKVSSPTGPKIKRRPLAEPTMTFHSKAATNDVYDLFNQPLSCEAEGSKEDSESDLDDDGYSTTGESTGTGMVSGPVSEVAVDEEEDTGVLIGINMGNFTSGNNTSGVTENGGEWTEFSTSKDVPNHQQNNNNNNNNNSINISTNIMDSEDNTTNTFSQTFEDAIDVSISQKIPSSHEELKTPVEAESDFFEEVEEVHTRYVPIPPEDYDPNSMRPLRDQATTAQNRLPFMTPIVEKTESSLAANTMYQKPESDYFNSKTPSRSPRTGGSGQLLDTTPSQSPCESNASPNNVDSEWVIFDKEGIFIKPSVTTPAKRALRLSLGGDENENEASPSPKRVQVIKTPKTEEGKAKGLGLSLTEDPFVSPRKGVRESPVKKQQEFEFIKLALPVQKQQQPSSTLNTTALFPSKPIITDLQCNPTDPSIRQQILSSLNPSLSAYPGYNHYPDITHNKYKEIQKFVKKVATAPKASPRKTPKASPRKTPSKSTSASANVGNIANGDGSAPSLVFSTTNRVYVIKRELGKGAFAPVWLAESTTPDEKTKPNGNNDNNDDFSAPLATDAELALVKRASLEAIKAESPPLQSHWEFHITRLIRNRLLSQDQSSRALLSLIQAHELHSFSDEAYLVLDYHPSGTLLDLVNSSRAANAAAGSREQGLDEPLAMLFTIEVLRVLEASFSVGVLHGDLKADNYLLRLPSTSVTLNAPYHPAGTDGWDGVGVTLIDFGRGIDVLAFSPRVGFIADWDASSPTDAPEIRDKRPWVWSIDTWGAAGVVHSLLFGKYLDTVEVGGGGGSLGGKGKKYKLRESFKRYWQQELWSAVFEGLLNPSVLGMPAVGGSDDCGRGQVEGFCRGIAGVRGEMEAWLEREGEKKGLRAAVKRVEGLVRR